MRNITSSNATILLTAEVVFPQPFQLQEFAADDIFGTEPIQAGEEMMGVDGHLTAGFVNVPTSQSFALMADSFANYFFDQVYQRERADQTKYELNGVILLTSVGTKWTLTRGFLKTYAPLPDAKKVLQPRRHTIIWQTARPTPS